MAHPDEVVKPEREEPSRLVSEAKLRHELAKSESATAQERKQAEVEQAHALSTRPDGSYAQLHESEKSTLAVADPGEVKSLRKEHGDAVAKLQGKSESAETAPASENRAAAPR